VAAHGPCLVKINAIKDWISSEKVFGMPLSIHKHKPRAREEEGAYQGRNIHALHRALGREIAPLGTGYFSKKLIPFVPVLAEK
jgi:hypothetical protein